MKPLGRPAVTALAAFTVVGAALRTWQYLAQSSLRLDELAVARNIVDRGVRELVAAPLDYDQIAPVGFLLFEKLAVSALGPSEWAFRLLPFLASMAALLIMPWLSARLLPAGAAVVATALFASGSILVLFAAQAKPYAVDLFAALVLIALAGHLERRRTLGAAAGLALAGAVLVWFAIGAVLVLAGLGLGLALLGWRWRRAGAARSLVPVAVAWLLAGTLAALVARRGVSPGQLEYFAGFFQGSFPPAEPLGVLEWSWRSLVATFGRDLGYSWPVPYAVLTVIGVGAVLRRSRGVAPLLLAPPLATVAAAVCHVYPLGSRTTLFLLPWWCWLAGSGAEEVRRAAARVAPALGWVVVALLLVPPLRAAIAFRPVAREHVKPVLASLQQEWRAGDVLYVYYAAWQAVEFYGRQYGLRDDDVEIGGCHRTQPRNYLFEIDRFRGRPRVWLLFTHTSRAGEEATIVGYLDAIGVRGGSVDQGAGKHHASGATTLYWYDLSDSLRLRRATAESFPVLTPKVDLRLSCTNGPQVPRLDVGRPAYR
ncbi:MAG: hypothetical protein ACREOF_12605 [Gemmatimonadales bacterium]